MREMSEQNPTEVAPEYHAVEQIEQSEPSRLPVTNPPIEQAEAWDDSDVELADEDVSDGPDGNLSGIDQ
jgi:hypothetical protein